MFHSDPDPDVNASDPFLGVPILAGAFRFLTSSATCLVGVAILVGIQARPRATASSGNPPEAVRIDHVGQKPRVVIVIPGAENASHFILAGPTGEELFEVTGFRDGHVDVRSHESNPSRVTLSSNPQGRVDVYLRRQNATPTIHMSPDRLSVKVAIMEGQTAVSAAELRIRSPEPTR